jgi:WhiB family redox-sensing transcriptional regulator
VIVPALDGTAACTEVGDPNLWFPEQGDTNKAAKAKQVCRGCPVREQCLTWALTTNERGGIWGGLGEVERDKLRIKRFGDGHKNRTARAAARRVEVIRLTREGRSSKEIAGLLSMSESTVTTQRSIARQAGQL